MQNPAWPGPAYDEMSYPGYPAPQTPCVWSRTARLPSGSQSFSLGLHSPHHSSGLIAGKTNTTSPSSMMATGGYLRHSSHVAVSLKCRQSLHDLSMAGLDCVMGGKDKCAGDFSLGA